MPLKLGDIVRARLVATVTAVDQAAITVTTFGATQVVFPKAIANDPGFAYELTPVAEPAYAAGELYTDAHGAIYQRIATDQPGDRWRVLVHPNRPTGQYVGEQVPARPLTHLVPEAAAPAPGLSASTPANNSAAGR